MFLKHCGYDMSHDPNRSYYHDPITGIICNFNNNIRYECNGFMWNPAHIYLLEKYDLRLTKEFLALFSDEERMQRDIYEICKINRNKTDGM